MKSSRDRRGATIKSSAMVLCATSIVGILASFVLTYLNGSELVSSGLPFLPFASAVVGYLIAVRQPRNLVGWIFLVSALFATIRAVCGEYAIYGIQTSPGDVPLAQVAAWISIFFRMPGPFLSFVLLPLFFPNGRTPSPRWNVVAWIALITAPPVMLLDALAPGEAVYGTGIPNPMGIEALAFYTSFYSRGLIVWFIGLIFLAAASLIFRYRASDSIGRQQIKWLTLAAAVIPVWFTINGPIDRAFPVVFAVVDSLVIAAVPVAAGIAILRYRLYDIDFIINKALVYTSLTAMIVVAYSVLVGSLEYLIRLLTGENSQLVIVVSTLAIAAIFNPFRRLVQRFVDRRFYRRKYNARATLDGFSGTLREEVELDQLQGGLVRVVKKTLQPDQVSLLLLPVGGEVRATEGERKTLADSSRKDLP